MNRETADIGLFQKLQYKINVFSQQRKCFIVYRHCLPPVLFHEKLDPLKATKALEKVLC